MLSVKELHLLRRAIDNIDIDSDCYIENKEWLQRIRDKICDMIELQHAWNSGKRIEIQKDLLV